MNAAVVTAGGVVRFRRIEVEHLAGVTGTLHRWLTHPSAVFWQMTGNTVEDTAAYVRGIVASPDEVPWWGELDGQAVVYVETYDPARLLPAEVYEPSDGDLGMHILVAPAAGPVRHGLTSDVFSAVMRLCVDVLKARRVVVEPDVRNHRVAAMNARAGFRVDREIVLPDKRAALSSCSVESFRRSESAARSRLQDPSVSATNHSGSPL